jgi:WD40 repeat protein
MLGGLLGTSRDRAAHGARRPMRNRSAARSVWLMLGAWQPFMVLVGSITAVAYFAAKPCASAMPEPQATLRGQTGSVGSVVFSADGGILSSVGVNGSIVLWDLATHEGDPFPPVGPGQNHCVAFSPDGKLLATGSPTKGVAFHNLAEDESWPLFDSSAGSAGAKCLAFAPDGSTLAVGQKDGRITLWNIATRQKQSTLQGHTEFVASLVFAPDGRSLVSSGGDRIARLWNLATGRTRFAIPDQESMFVSFAFSPDSQVLILADQRSPVVRLCDVTSGSERAVLHGPESDILAVAISPDGHTLAAADFHGLIYCWDLPTLKCSPLRLPHAGIQTLAFAPDSHTLASGGFDGTVHLWDWPPHATTNN